MGNAPTGISQKEVEMSRPERILAAIQRHKARAWLGLLAYACAVTFPHQQVQDAVGFFTDRYTNERVWKISVDIALFEGAVFMLLFLIAVYRLNGWIERSLLIAFWLFTFALLFGSHRMFMVNNAELVHYPQYFPEGIALLALTGSPTQSMIWIVILGGLDEAYQYTFLVTGKAFPYDFNDIYMDLVGGAAGIVFGLALFKCGSRVNARGWASKLFTSPAVKLLAGIFLAGFALLTAGKMVLYEADSPHHWFALSRLPIPQSRYFSPWIFGLHHFHELTPVEGPILILVTIAIFALLDRALELAPARQSGHTLKAEAQSAP